jgi:hypothetical protein
MSSFLPNLEEIGVKAIYAAMLLQTGCKKAAAGFLSHRGHINRFNHPKQIIKLAGLNLRKIVQVTTRG